MAEKKKVNLLDKAKEILKNADDPEKALKNLSPEMKKAIKLEYGYAFALIMSSPDLTKLFTKAVTQGLTERAFQEELRNTKWYTTRTESQRAYEAATKTKDMQSDLNVTRQKIVDEIKREAMAANGVTVDDAEARNLAETLLKDNYYDWKDVLGRVVGDIYVNENVLTWGGAAATAGATIKQYAKEMGVFVDDSTLGKYVDGIANQSQTLENVYNNINNLAISYYPQFAENIKSGATVSSIAQQYTSTAAQMLEKDPADFSFYGNDPVKSDPLMAKAMFGGKDGKAMSMYDFRKVIKQDARWKTTRNAREEYAGITNNILKTFGAI